VRECFLDITQTNQQKTKNKKKKVNEKKSMLCSKQDYKTNHTQTNQTIPLGIYAFSGEKKLNCFQQQNRTEKKKNFFSCVSVLDIYNNGI